MSDIIISCPSCDKKFRLSSKARLGKRVKCSVCEEIFVAEEPERKSTPARRSPKKTAPASQRRPKQRRKQEVIEDFEEVDDYGDEDYGYDDDYADEEDDYGYDEPAPRRSRPARSGQRPSRQRASRKKSRAGRRQSTDIANFFDSIPGGGLGLSLMVSAAILVMSMGFSGFALFNLPFFLVGLGACMYGYIKILGAAFAEDTLTGLLCILFGVFYTFYFIMTRWDYIEDDAMLFVKGFGITFISLGSFLLPGAL